MPVHRADCEDCAWSFEDEDLVDVSDEMERHARKEMHDVDLERAVATDGAGFVLVSRFRGSAVYHYPDPDQPDHPRCSRDDVARHEYRRRAVDSLPDRYSLCQYCDPDEDVRPQSPSGPETAAALRRISSDAVGEGGISLDDEDLVTDGGHAQGSTAGATHPYGDRSVDQAYLGPDVHLCDTCRRTFRALDKLADHNCDSPGGVLVDGGDVDA